MCHVQCVWRFCRNALKKETYKIVNRAWAERQTDTKNSPMTINMPHTRDRYMYAYICNRYMYMYVHYQCIDFHNVTGDEGFYFCDFSCGIHSCTCILLGKYRLCAIIKLTSDDHLKKIFQLK